jgi:hypothetical protein
MLDSRPEVAGEALNTSRPRSAVSFSPLIKQAGMVKLAPHNPLDLSPRHFFSSK